MYKIKIIKIEAKNIVISQIKSVTNKKEKNCKISDCQKCKHQCYETSQINCGI